MSVLTPFISSFLLGILYGWTSCTLVCIPFVSLYIIGSDKGVWNGLRATLIFNIGRIATYTVLGLIVGFLGEQIIGRFIDKVYGNILFSYVLVIIGVTIMFTRDEQACGKRPKKYWFLDRLPQNPYLKAFVLGLFIAFVPCAGLLSVLSISAVSLSPLTGALAALLFGIGSSLSPLFFVGAGAGWFAQKVHLNSPNLRIWVRRVSGALLVIIGFVMFFLAIK